MIKIRIEFELYKGVTRFIFKCFWIKTCDDVDLPAILLFVDGEGLPGRPWTHASLRPAGFENLVKDMKWRKYTAGAKVRDIVNERRYFSPFFHGIAMQLMSFIVYDSHKFPIR